MPQERGADTRTRWGWIAVMTTARLQRQSLKFIATQIAIDTPQLNHRHVAVLNDAGDEIFEAPIRSKPPVS
jgi:hypothetical protein